MHTNTCIQMYFGMLIRHHSHTQAHVSVYEWKLINVPTCLCVSVCIYMCMYMYKCIYINIHIIISLSLHIYIYIYIHKIVHTFMGKSTCVITTPYHV